MAAIISRPQYVKMVWAELHFDMIYLVVTIHENISAYILSYQIKR